MGKPDRLHRSRPYQPANDAVMRCGDLLRKLQVPVMCHRQVPVDQPYLRVRIFRPVFVRDEHLDAPHRFLRNHWNAEEPMRSIEVFIASGFFARYSFAMNTSMLLIGSSAFQWLRSSFAVVQTMRWKPSMRVKLVAYRSFSTSSTAMRQGLPVRLSRDSISFSTHAFSPRSAPCSRFCSCCLKLGRRRASAASQRSAI